MWITNVIKMVKIKTKLNYSEICKYVIVLSLSAFPLPDSLA